MVTRKHCRKKNRRKPKLESYSYVPVCMHQVCLYYSSRVVVPLIMPVCASQQHRHYVERQPALYTPHTAILVNPIPSVPSVSTGTIAGNRHCRGTTTATPFCTYFRFALFRTAVPFRRQTTQNLSGLSPKRDCGPKRVSSHG